MINNNSYLKKRNLDFEDLEDWEWLAAAAAAFSSAFLMVNGNGCLSTFLTSLICPSGTMSFVES